MLFVFGSVLNLFQHLHIFNNTVNQLLWEELSLTALPHLCAELIACHHSSVCTEPLPWLMGSGIKEQRVTPPPVHSLLTRTVQLLSEGTEAINEQVGARSGVHSEMPSGGLQTFHTRLQPRTFRLGVECHKNTPFLAPAA